MSSDDVLIGSALFDCHHGACLPWLRSLPDGCCDAAISDPPYGTGQWQRAESGAGSDCRAVHSIEEWDIWNPAWITEALRVSRGAVLTFLPQTRLEEMFAFGRSIGVPTRMLLWIKTDPRPRFQGQPAYGFEPIIAFRPLNGGGHGLVRRVGAEDQS